MSVDVAAFREIVAKKKPEEEAWVLPIQHLSPSSLGMLQRCPEQYRQRYILGRKERPASNLTLGSATHRAVEHNLIQKISSHEDLPVREAVEFFYDVAWPKAVERDGGVDEIEWRTDPDTCRTTGAGMVELYHEAVMPRIQPLATEEDVTLDVGLPVPLFGKIDITTEDVVVDLKTSSRKVTEVPPKWALQGGIYMLFRQRPVHWHVLTSTRVPASYTPLESPGLLQEHDVTTVRATMQTVDRLAWMANAFMQKYGPDQPWPMTGHQAEFGCGKCGFRKYCAAWGNG